jgi:DNA-binding SARP family transcriptional activator
MTMISSQDDGNHLFTCAVLKLNPEIFSDPVWLRFGKQEKTLTPGTIDNLLSEAKKLQKHDPSNACQVLLICAVYQNLAGQRNEALRSVQQALALARRNSLSKEMIWSIWGACAICFQEGDYEQAARYSEQLQSLLDEQNEWIMANFVDVLKQALLQPVSLSREEQNRSFHDQPHRDLLGLTFDWLKQWGYSPEACEVEFKVDMGQQIRKVRPLGSLQQPLSSVQRRRGAWHIFTLMVQGKLSLHWAEKDRHLVKEQPSFRRSFLKSLRLLLSGRKIGPQIAQDVPQFANASITIPTNNLSPPNLSLLDEKSTSTNERVSLPATTVIPITVQMLGPFSITIQESPLKLPSSRGLALLKYLLLHHKQDTPRDVLMDIFWPDADPEAARNNLNVAMHGLRQALRSHTDVVLIRFEDCAYGLSPNLEIWLDVEEFEKCIKSGQQLEAQKKPSAAVAQYEGAVNLYREDFLADNPYEGWTVLDRERLRVAYLDTLDRLSRIYFSQEQYAACITLCQLILTRDLCREDANCRLMQCYSRLGQGPLALRQYQICMEALRTELEVDPTPETTQLYNCIRNHDRV